MSASTGTADDRDGNKLTPLVDDKRKKYGAFSATSSWTGWIAGTVIYDTSRGGMQPGGTGKSPTVANW
ncbi:hypothetical protein JQ625_29050 [Bradyrhizobium diazoefficiens]|nr:hypothetical protein [Bradyrhizobium diazoefficiens]MBR0778892.1 hypothetical protein [Bradyrhizobium diazoefficiens]